MKASEVHNLSLDELKVEEERLRKELFSLKSVAVTQKVENPKQFKNIKRDIARLLTERRARQTQEKAKA